MFVSLNDLLGLGQVAARRDPSGLEARAISQQAISINDRSRSLPVAALPGLEGEARAALALLDTYQPFEKFSWLLFSYDSSQTVRANLQAAISNIRVKTGAKEGAIHGQQKDVNLLTETAKNYPGAVGERAKELGNAAGDALKCVKDPITCWWEKTSKTQKLAVGLGAGVLTLGAVVYTTTIFSGAITAVGNVAEKLTKNAPKRRRKAR